MEKTMIVVNVTTANEKGEHVDALCIKNCAPQQLNSVLSLCKKDYSVLIEFSEVDIPNVMRPNTQD